MDTATCISSECDVLLVCCLCKNLRYYGSSSEENQRKSQFYDIRVEIIILSYAFKMRQDYLSTNYLDQKYLPSERSKTREIWMDPSNVCWDNLVSFWRHMMIFFSHLHYFTDEISYYKSSSVCLFVCLSVCLFVPYLLRGPLTDLRQTWWVYVGGPRNCPWGVLFRKGQRLNGSTGHFHFPLYYICASLTPHSCKRRLCCYCI